MASTTALPSNDDPRRGTSFDSENACLRGLVTIQPDFFQQHVINVTLQQGQALHEEGSNVAVTYFPCEAVVSLGVGLATNHTIEVASVGRDGLVGLTCECHKPASSRAFVRFGGAAFAIDTHELAELAGRDLAVADALLTYQAAVLAQVEHMAACNASHSLEQRLCRWLLNARDLRHNSMLPVTQEEIAEALGVRRTSVTLVFQLMQRDGLVRIRRGRVDLLNPTALQARVCECYEAIGRCRSLSPGSAAPEWSVQAS
jgi:CRP-like cAMP-binding protein